MPIIPAIRFRWTHWTTGIVALFCCAWLTAGSWQANAPIPAEDWHADLRADAAGYYVYLPAFFHWGFRADTVPATAMERGGNGFQLDRERNAIMTKYTCGVALLQMPFYLIAEGVRGWGATDGFSDVHRRCVELAAVLYWLSGSLLLAVALQRIMPAAPWVPPVVLVFIGLGSNVFFYAFRMPGFSHIYSFFAICLALFALITGVLPGKGKVWLFGIACALIMLIRPSDAVAVLGFHVWILLERRALLTSPWFWSRQVLCALLVWAPQLIYWKHVHGAWVVYSYGNEGFTNWDAPRILEFLFAPKSGWLPYTPVLLLLPLGIAALWRDQRHRMWLLLGIVAANVYLCASWYAWDFGCSCGARPMVQYMPFVAFFLWAFLRRNDERGVRLRYAVLPILGLLVFVNYRSLLQYDVCFSSESIWDWDAYGRNIARAFIGGINR